MKKSSYFRKKVLLGSLFFSLFATSLFAQQIPRLGVVDTALVYSTHFRESAAVRNYELKRANLQVEVDKITQELKELQQKKVEYEKNNNSVAALRLEAEITKKAEYITEYTRAKNIELETLRKNLSNSDEFYEKLYQVINRIAESEGYSMILSLQQANVILWYSPTVDITDKVIAGLGSL